MDVFNRYQKRYAIAGFTLLAAGLSLPAMADTYTNDDGQRVNCHYEQSKSDDGHPVRDPVIGAVAGGVVGHQFGKGTGNDVATVAGAGAGAYAGKKYNDNQTEKSSSSEHQVCHPAG
jgi:uncharacterized protein YcfJ